MYGGHIITVGGNDGVSAVDTVYYAPLTNDGLVGTWQTTTSLPAAREGHTSAIFGSRLYIIGGTVSGSVSDSVISAPINSNGTLGAWRTETSLPVVRSDHASVVYKNYIYVIAGKDGPTNTDVTATSYVASINADGSINSWQTTDPISTVRHDLEAVVYGDYIYRLSGIQSGGSVSSTVQYSAIADDGTLSWQFTDNAPLGSGDFDVIAVSGYLVYFLNDEFYFGKIHNNGAVLWIDSARDEFGSNAVDPTLSYYNGTVIAVDEDDIVTAEFAEYGIVDNPTDTNQDIPDRSCGLLCTSRGLIGHQVVSYKEYVYVLGGIDEEDDGSATYTSDQVYYTSVSNSGLIGAWQTTTSLPEPRELHSAIVFDNYLIIVGGLDDNNDPVGDVYYSEINKTDGTLGAWQLTSSLSVGRYSGDLVIMNGQLYYIGGSSSDSVSRAQINHDADSFSLGQWFNGGTLPGARSAHQTVSIGDRVYVIGGQISGDARTDSVIYSESNSTGTLSNWQTGPSLPDGLRHFDLVQFNDTVQIIGGDSDANGLSSGKIYVAEVDDNESISQWLTSQNTVPDHSYSDSVITSVNTTYIRVAGVTPIDTYSEEVYSERVYLTQGNQRQSLETHTDLPINMNGHATVSHGGYLYVIPKSNNSTYYGSIERDGDITSWQTTSISPIAALGDEGIYYAFNGFIYGMNRSSSTDTIYVTKIQSDGSLSPWRIAGKSSFALSTRYIFVKDNYLYLIVSGDIHSAPIKSDGTIGTVNDVYNSSLSTSDNMILVGDHLFSISNPSIYSIGIGENGTVSGGQFEVGRLPHDEINDTQWGITDPALTTVNGKHLYIIGGRIGTSELNTVWLGEVDGGTIREWHEMSNISNSRRDFSAADVDGRVYYTGGLVGGAADHTVRSIVPNSTSYIASYFKLFDFGAEVKLKNIEISNSKIDRGDITVQLAGSSAAFQSESGVDSYNRTCTNGVLTQYVFARIDIDDRNNRAIYNDVVKSSFDDLTAYYDLNLPFGVPVTERLRGGKHFDSEILMPLDTDELEEDASKCSIP